MDSTSKLRGRFVRRALTAAAVTVLLFCGLSAFMASKIHSERALRARQEAALAALEGERVYVLQEVGQWPLVDYLPESIAESFETFEALTVLLDGPDATVANLERLREVPQLTRLVITGAALNDEHQEILNELPTLCPQLQPIEIYDSLDSPEAKSAMTSVPAFDGTFLAADAAAAWNAAALPEGAVIVEMPESVESDE